MEGSPGSSPIKFLPQKKIKLHIDLLKCIICQQITKEKLCTATQTGIDCVVSASKVRQDNIWQRIEAEETSSQAKVVYHRSCYQSYTSSKNLTHAQKGKTTDHLDSTQASNEHLPTRTRTPSLTDWSTCLVCNSRKRDKVHKIQTLVCQESLLTAAKSRNDIQMLGRLEGVDLIAVEAVYHGSCMASYVSKHNITGALKEEQRENTFQLAFDQLIQGIDQDLHKGTAFKMNSLLEKFKGLLPDDVEKESYTTQKLQQRFMKHYGEAIIVHGQRGQSQSCIMLSSKVTLADAVKACAKLKETFKVSQMGLGTLDEDTGACMDKDRILHAAAGILREEIAQIPTTEEYFAATEINMQTSENFVPPLLKKTILWLLSTDAFRSGTSVSSEKLLRKALALAQCAIYSSRNQVITPLHLGLAAQLHHDYGKKDIIDTLHAHGFCVSYDEMRRFITALGQDEVNRMQGNVYIPHGLMPRAQGGSLIQEGDDNIDINCETVDGKGTFHSMARVVFQEQPVHTDAVIQRFDRIKVGQEKSLPLNSENESLLKTVMLFDKPKQRPEPQRIENAGAKVNALATDWSGIEVSDISWLFLRMIPRGVLPLPPDFPQDIAQKIPFWTGFHSSLAEKKDSFTVATYAPVIDAKPADPATVYTTMSKCKDMTLRLGQANAVQTMDQQLYAVAQQVKWTKPEEFQNHVLRLGGFHSTCCFISVIGKVWGDGGLRDLLVESGVYASNTVDQMLNGKQFHRSVRGLILSYEALMQLLLSEFLKWCSLEPTRRIPEEMCDHLKDTWAAMEQGTQQQKVNAVKELNALITQHILPLLQQFRERGCKESPTFKYWSMYLDAIHILLCSIRAERECNWKLHLASQLKMLPYFFATDHYNYSRWVPVYLLDMAELPNDVADAFQQGQFAVRRTAGAFNGVWSDLGTETTVIRDAKSDGGVIGLTRKESALLRWTLTRGILGEYARATKMYSGQYSSEHYTHEQEQPSAMRDPLPGTD